MKIYKELSAHQKELVDNGHKIVWEAIDADQEPVFESYSLNKVIEFAKGNDEVTHISKYVEV